MYFRNTAFKYTRISDLEKDIGQTQSDFFVIFTYFTLRTLYTEYIRRFYSNLQFIQYANIVTTIERIDIVFTQQFLSIDSRLH